MGIVSQDSNYCHCPASLCDIADFFEAGFFEAGFFEALAKKNSEEE
jgi:hypothetical protein